MVRTRQLAGQDQRMEPAVEQLRHDGVTLRRWRADDTDTAYRIVTDSLNHLAPWMPWASGGYSEQDAVAYVERCEVNWRSGAEFNYAIVAPDGEIVGSCSLMARVGPGGLEIGYWVHPEYTGHGIATRAAAALTEEAFRIGAERVVIVHDEANERSGAIPKRLGFTQIDRRPSQEPVTSAGAGWDIVWERVRISPSPK